MPRAAFLLALLISAVSFADSSAQSRSNQQPSKQRSRVRGVSPARVLEARFNRYGPQVGDKLPAISAYDEDGNELNLVSLKGHYTVLTFGCLT